jgi:carbon monoxide dehydrogenase subunit G
MADSTTATITVAAPSAAVMAVISDFAAYPEWASAVRSTDVLARDGAGLASRVRFELDAGLVKDTYVLGYRWDGNAGVRWDLAEPGSAVSGMTGGYLLADQGGRTEVTYDLAVDVRIPMPGILKRRAEKMIIDAALKGLKERVEAREGEQR